MFGFGKKRFKLAAPCRGRIIDITQVPDEVFSVKMMGDGFAVEPAEEDICAPCDGKVVLVAATKHAVALERDGVQILLHAGLDTVDLNGKGLQTFVQQGDMVKQGQKLLTFDRAYLKSQQKPDVTMVVLTNAAEAVSKVEKNLQDSDAVLEITVK